MRKRAANTLNLAAVRANPSIITRWSRSECDEDESYIVETTNNETRRNRSVVAPSPSGWYRIQVCEGQKYHREYFLVELRRAIYPNILVPYFLKTENKFVQFYVDDINVAKELAAADRTISLPHGFAMEIKVDMLEPYYNFDLLLRNMEEVLKSRYNAASKIMDLSRFYANEQLRNTYCPLNRPHILHAAIDIIARIAPDVEALILNDNKINFLRMGNSLGTILPNLKNLCLARNGIATTDSLEFINQTNIVEISLIGNPVREKYNETAVYMSIIRRRFPKLRKLDGVDLPPLIGFDVDDENFELPTPKRGFLCHPSCLDVAEKWLEYYYLRYDSADRCGLEEAYHDQALLSLTVRPDATRFSSYLPFSRNLNYLRDFDARMSTLKCGKADIGSLLSQLPPTKHVYHSFTLDVTVSQGALMVLTVTGMFCEQDAERAFPEQSMRAFHRTFVITIQGGSSICIVNDMLHMNRLTWDQEKAVKGALAGFEPSPSIASNCKME